MVPLIFSSTPRSDRSAAALPAPHRGWRLSVTPVGDGWVGEASRPGRNGAPRALACETGAQRAGVLAALRARIDARRAGFVAARRLAEPVDIASVEEFLDALDQVDPQDGRLAMLVAHAAAPGRTLPASEIGRAGGHDGAQGASMHYGRLARDLAEAMELRPDPEHLAVGCQSNAPPALVGVEARELAVAPIVLRCALESSDLDRASDNQLLPGLTRLPPALALHPSSS